MPARTKPAADEPGKKKDEAYPLLDTARKVLMAAIGAVALAQDEIEDFVHRLVERGEIAEKEGRQLIDEIKSKRKKETTRVEQMVNERIDTVLEKMRIPTKSDLDALSEKIAALTKKIDELKKS